MPVTKTASRKPQTTRKRTPTLMIRPKVQEVLAQVVNENQLPPRREIAMRAGISQQTLYNHALDLVEAAEKAWAANRSAPSDPDSKPMDGQDILRQKNDEIARLQRQIDELTERMRWMLQAVQQYAPKALPEVTKVLLPTYSPSKED